MDGSAGAHTDGDEPLFVQLQPSRDSRADAHYADAHRAEPDGAIAADAPASRGFSSDRRAVHADDADQDHGDFSAARAGLGAACELRPGRPRSSAIVAAVT